MNEKLNEDKLSELRKISGYEATKFIENNFIVGLGTGRNAKCFIDALGKKIKEEKLNIVGVPTSDETKEYAIKKGIKVKELNEILKERILDIDVDGADQVAHDFSLIKGHGGALTREKIIAKSSKKFICVVDETKISKNLNKPVPIEVIPFALEYVKRRLKEIYNVDCEIMKKEGKNFITDNKNFILLANFGEISNPEKLEDELNLISGVVENGIFAKRKPDIVIVGKEKVEILERK